MAVVNSQLLDYLAAPKPLVNLEPRKQEELEFHDEHHGADDPNVRAYSICNTPGGAHEYVKEWIATNAPGSTWLDYACGMGWKTTLAAEAGAELAVGIDLSTHALNRARHRTQNLSNIRFIQADCEDTGFPPDCFDRIMCSGMMHHLDLNRAIPEMKRILKPGGKALAVEALSYNPLIQAYRRRTPELRTEWEARHILNHKSLRFIEQYLAVRNLRYFHLADLAAIPLYGTSLFRPGDRFTKMLDKLFLRIPGLRLMAWIFIFEMHKTSA